MPARVAGIHVLIFETTKAWMAGTSRPGHAGPMGSAGGGRRVWAPPAHDQRVLVAHRLGRRTTRDADHERLQHDLVATRRQRAMGGVGSQRGRVEELCGAASASGFIVILSEAKDDKQESRMTLGGRFVSPRLMSC